MRKNFVLVVLVPLVLVLTVVWIFHNQWIESGLEYSAEEIVGAKVEIDNLNLTLDPIGIEFTRMQVGNPNDPWENLIETDSVKFEMDAAQLIRGKYIIEEIAIHNVSIGTKRTTDGSLPMERRDRAILAGDKFTFAGLADQALSNLVTTTPLFDLAKLKDGFNPDSLIKILDVKSLQHLDTLKSGINNIEADWKGLSTDFESSKAKVLDLKERITKINVNELKDVTSITNALVTVDQAVGTVNELKDLVTSKSKTIKSDLTSLTNSIAMIDDIVKSDFGKLKDMARLPSFNSDGMAKMLVGTEMYKRAMNYMSYLDATRANIQEYTPKPEKEEVPRMKGQDISFPADEGFPKLWVKKVLITANSDKYIETGLFNASGVLTNYSDNQKITGEPFAIMLDSKFKDLRSLKVSGIIDRRKDTPTDTYDIKLAGVPLSDFTLGSSNFLPSKIKTAIMNTEVKLSVPGNSIDAELKLNLANLELLFENDPKNMVEDIVHRILMGLRGLDIGMRMWNTDGYFKFALTTNLDNMIATEIQKILGEEITKLQNQLRAKFDAMVMPQINKYRAEYENKLAGITDQLGGYEILLSDNLGLVDGKKKELEERLEKAKKGFLEDKLKGLFK
ncbi:MAG: TIGR03545 family protein [Bacteroidetes bacterium]|nr:TIGR03545 family protein [Bacteroidota bacterium]